MSASTAGSEAAAAAPAAQLPFEDWASMQRRRALRDGAWKIDSLRPAKSIDLSATGLLRGFAGVSRVFRRCFAGVSRIHESRFTCFAAVSQVFREIHDVKHVSRIRGDVSRIRGDSRVFRGCFADSRKKIHVFRGCFTAVSHCESVQ